eukprot:IDg18167t1
MHSAAQRVLFVYCSYATLLCLETLPRCNASMRLIGVALKTPPAIGAQEMRQRSTSPQLSMS